MHKTPKPVRKCHRCPLNLGDRCAVFSNPRKQWDSGTCRGLQDEALHRQHLERLAKHPTDRDKEDRRHRARLAKTEPHHDGTLSHRSPLVDRRRSP